VLRAQSPGSCGQQRQERTEDVGCNRRWLDLQLPDLSGRDGRGAVQISPPGCREPSRLLPARRWITEDGPHPPNELGAAAMCERSSFSPAVPPTCHKQRSPAVHSGQSRSLREGRPAGHTLLTCGGWAARNCMACKGSLPYRRLGCSPLCG